MSKTPGYLFELPDALLKGGMYIPLEHQVVLPGGAALIRSSSRDNARIFESLAAQDEVFTTVLATDASQQSSYHPVGTLSLVADHKQHPDGSWVTIIAGIGRVRMGETYLVAESPFPRMDVSKIATTCEDEELARARLRAFGQVASSLGSRHPDLVAALHRYAQDDGDPSLSADRLAGLVAVGKPDLLQGFLAQPDVIKRFDMLDAQLLDYMARVTGRDIKQNPDGDMD